MSGPAKVALGALLAFATVVAAVFAGNDRTILVAPPEAVAEGFVRDLVGGRDELAIKYVDPRAGVSPVTVRLGAQALRRRGGRTVPNDVEGRAATITGDSATATATVRGEAAAVDVRIWLIRLAGVWRITDWRLE